MVDRKSCILKITTSLGTELKKFPDFHGTRRFIHVHLKMYVISDIKFICCVQTRGGTEPQGTVAQMALLYQPLMAVEYGACKWYNVWREKTEVLEEKCDNRFYFDLHCSFQAVLDASLLLISQLLMFYKNCIYSHRCTLKYPGSSPLLDAGFECHSWSVNIVLRSENTRTASLCTSFASMEFS